MSNGRTTISEAKKTRYSYKDRVVVIATGKSGKVLRRKDDQYTIVLDDGTRVYTSFADLQLEPIEDVKKDAS